MSDDAIRRLLLAGVAPSNRLPPLTVKLLHARLLLHRAQRVFDEMPHPSTISWTALITAYMDAGDLREAASM
uniref:Pentatricopeptide repeat-containing protein n=1 Tax=Oryza barthii TaxID=65489 RepID=A0A0D3HQJ0_9ORYZ